MTVSAIIRNTAAKHPIKRIELISRGFRDRRMSRAGGSAIALQIKNRFMMPCNNDNVGCSSVDACKFCKSNPVAIIQLPDDGQDAFETS